MLAAVFQLGLYDVVKRAATAKRIPMKGVRMVIDATIAALSIGERSVEGVRRLATPTAAYAKAARSASRSRSWR